MIRKPLHEVAEAEFRRFPVWRYTLGETEAPEDADEATVAPIAALPAPYRVDLILAAQLQLANGDRRFGLLTGLSPRPEVNEHLLAVAIFLEGRPVRLARCYDPDFAENGPAAFAARLGLDQASVFPIRYDVRAYFRDPAEGFAGEIREAPRRRLSEEEFVELCVKADLE